jgi:quercetin dioxygenase-like cupin family protein
MRETPDTLTACAPADGTTAPLAPAIGKGVIGGSGASEAQILALQSRMMAMTEHHIEIVPVHRFAHGLYSREVTLPEGCTAVGHRHAQEHICIISKGRVLVVTEDGTDEICAPATLIVPRGRKNCVHALEETVWTTVHASNAVTVEEAEATLILPEPQLRIEGAR